MNGCPLGTAGGDPRGGGHVTFDRAGHGSLISSGTTGFATGDGSVPEEVLPSGDCVLAAGVPHRDRGDGVLRRQCAANWRLVG